MRTTTLAIASLFLAACAATSDEMDQAVSENDPVQDFIELHNLEQVTVIRGFENPNVLYMEDPRYIIAYLRDEQWLVQYAHECHLAHVRSSGRPSDKRRSTRTLYVHQDTFRGCPLKALYPITLAHAKELVTIGTNSVDR
jgi:hypothetical protein